MLLTKLLRSTTFRLTAGYFAVFSLSAFVLLAFVYLMSVQIMHRQTRETIQAEIVGLEERFKRDLRPGLIDVIRKRSAVEQDLSSVYLLTDQFGDKLAGNLPSSPEILTLAAGEGQFTVEVPTGDDKFETHHFYGRFYPNVGGFRLLVGRDIEHQLRTQRAIESIMWLGAGVMLILALLGGFIMSRWTLARLETVNRTTTRIMAGELGRRIELRGGGDEFDELAQNLNAMLGRIERLVAGMREVTDNIAHDLRTPLNRLRGRIEVALMRELDVTEMRELLEATMAEADQLIGTFNALLSIARAEAGARQAEWEILDLTELASDVAELYEPLAEERRIELRLEPAGAPAPVEGSRQLLAQALANLTDNAIKYTPEGGRVTLRVVAGAQPRVEVLDTGPGIPAEMRDKALERFVRLENDRSTPGNGLGLSLVKAVAQLHDAALDLADNDPGLRVVLTFRQARTEPS